MSKMIFINLPVTDLERSTAFYEAIGGRKEPKFSNEQAAMIVTLIGKAELARQFLPAENLLGVGTGRSVQLQISGLQLICVRTDSLVPGTINRALGQLEMLKILIQRAEAFADRSVRLVHGISSLRSLSAFGLRWSRILHRCTTGRRDKAANGR